jgi:hypothetical protein
MILTGLMPGSALLYKIIEKPALAVFFIQLKENGRYNFK